MLNTTLLKTVALVGALLAPGAALAASAIATTDVNLRAGPSTGYPAVNVVPAGDNVEVFGCLSNRSWCDVDYYGQRGWMSSNYLAYLRNGRRYTGLEATTYIGAPVVAFSFGNYWDDHYRGRSFYRDRDRYDGIYGRPSYRGEPRRGHREERVERRFDRIEDRRDDRRHWREDRRENRGEFREERREWRQDGREERRYDGY